MYTVYRQQGKAVSIIRESDGAHIPLRAWGNSDWIGFVEWVLAGNTIDLSDAEPTLEEQKAAKIAELNSWWAAQEASGITPQGANFALGITPSDIALLVGAFNMAQTAVAVGAASADGPFTLIDTAGTPHNFTLAELTGTLLSWGQQRSQLSGAYAITKAAIAAATTDELNAVAMPE